MNAFNTVYSDFLTEVRLKLDGAILNFKYKLDRLTNFSLN